MSETHSNTSPPGSPSDAETGSGPGSAAAPIRLLLVDDEAGFIRVMQKRLSRRGYVVDTAGSGAEALRTLRGAAYDAAVFDLKMDDMDGFELLRVVRRMAPEMAVIMLTGHGGAEEAREGMRLGAAGYLLKPCEMEELVCAIERALGRGAPG
ncbi:response regulator [Nitratidesulfovibrio sp. SRB-5]|uniref:response regulator n=1 Tax=Nitratidesulfovibrio sp. SRB-5 TaxID=2872636 RepID=UPI0010286E41|nr:response regulator [Nitratidesulfovibrio sp. SRB-5]MBZ2170499.1 response regulator [Nitratidesulfovibrio sp. SRB-5]RXF78034.1 response regulator [Desulfovibrio sp. DS-1]